MKKGPVIGIAIGASILVVIAVILISGPYTDEIKVDDALDIRESDTEIPEIQDRLDEIEKINVENEYTPKPREWLTSGPFQIDRSKYAIGEKIFLVIGGLNPSEKGEVAFMRPLNATHYSVYLSIPFDGAAKPAFNYYIEPQISKNRGICSVDDISGEWTVVFRGTNYPNLDFEITKEIVPGTDIESVC